MKVSELNKGESTEEATIEQIMEETKDIIDEAKATREEVMWQRLKVINEPLSTFSL